jgi:hypothetical protein
MFPCRRFSVQAHAMHLFLNPFLQYARHRCLFGHWSHTALASRLASSMDLLLAFAAQYCVPSLFVCMNRNPSASAALGEPMANTQSIATKTLRMHHPSVDARQGAAKSNLEYQI